LHLIDERKRLGVEARRLIDETARVIDERKNFTTDVPAPHRGDNATSCISVSGSPLRQKHSTLSQRALRVSGFASSMTQNHSTGFKKA
jgi:hypothetical protein